MTQRCKFCKRQMTDPLSIRVGFGPTCAKKHGLRVKVTVMKRKTEEVSYADADTFF